MRRWLFAPLAMSLVGLAAGASCPKTRAAEPAASGGRNAGASYESIYSCLSNKGCAFTWSRVNKRFTKLTIQLRRLEVGNETALALF
jgi:hypothetical protein